MAKKDYKNWTNADFIREISALKRRKKYGLVWEDKPEDVVLRCQKELPVLEEIKGLEIAAAQDAPVNLLIEGDNYHALSVLNYTHKGKIDVIYIDPPYNTGAKDWKYNDHWVDENDGYRHSKWLSMMANRLTLARNLLKENGVIFASIDDDEQHRLRMLMETIFNKVEMIIWRKTDDGRYGKMKHTKTVRNDHEYVIIGFKSYAKFSKIWALPFFNSRPRQDKKGRKWWQGYIARGEEGSNPNHVRYYSVTAPNGKKFTAQFEVDRAEFDQLNKDGYIHWSGSGTPYRKMYADEPRLLTCSSVFLDVGTTYQGKVDCEKILSEGNFPNPKPINLIRRLMELTTVNNQKAIILDFFAGSGTTGQAVSLLNKKDGGNRQFILCTNNENGIAREICRPRIKAVIEGHENCPEITGIPSNLKYYKTAFVPAQQTDANKLKLTKKSAEMLCVRENTFEEVKNCKSYKIFRNGKRYTGILYAESAIENFKKAAEKLDGKFSVYIFSLGDDDFSGEFSDMKNKVKVQPIPEAILRAYRHIFKKGNVHGT